MEADSMGGQLGNWLIENKIIEHIFGPNLHVEVLFCFVHSRNQLLTTVNILLKKETSRK